MSSSFKFEGLDELLTALKSLPQDLTEEAAGIIESTTSAAENEIRDGYPNRTGKLRDKVSSSVSTSGVSVKGVVKNTDPIAYIFEHGTQARHTAIGANRGSMPPGHVFSRVMPRQRRNMYSKLKDMLVRRGLMVSGDA